MHKSEEDSKKGSEMSSLSELNNMINILYEQYYKCYPHMERIPVNIEFTDDLAKKHFELRSDIKEQLIAEDIYSQQNFNGRMVAPCDIKDNISILLNTNKVVQYCNDGSMTWIGTFAHELTHAIDFYMMARKEKLQSYDELQQCSTYLMFQLWSEYHARKLGYQFLRTILGVDKQPTYSLKECIDHIQNTEWPTHKKHHFEEYHKNRNGNNQMYITMQLLGRYSVWCDLFPHNFNEDTFAMDFANEIWMQHLFSFMRHHETFDLIYENFDLMESIINENWQLKKE